MNARARSIRGRSPPHLSEILTDRYLVKIYFTTRNVRKPTRAQTGTQPALLLMFPTSVPQTLLKGRINCSSGLASVRPFPFQAFSMQRSGPEPEPRQRGQIRHHTSVAPCLTRGWASIRRVSAQASSRPLVLKIGQFDLYAGREIARKAKPRVTHGATERLSELGVRPP
jgi:hypothetical protein